MAQPRFLILSFDYPPLGGGISRLCAELARKLAQRVPDQVQVLSQRARAPQWFEAAEGTHEVRVPASRPARELQAVRELRRLQTGSAPGADPWVICGLWYPEAILAGLAGFKKRVIFAHGAELLPARARWRRALWRKLARASLDGARLVIANSHFTAALVRKLAPKAHVVALPLGVDAEKFKPLDRAECRRRFGADRELVIGSVSRLHRFKGHETVFRALQSLPPEARSRIRYLIAGTGPDRAYLERQATSLGVADCVRWLGHVADSALPALYSALDLFTLCTRQEENDQNVEGFGLVFLEAQACGTPVVGTRTGGIPDAIHPGEGGWLIEQDDHTALSSLLSEALTDPAKLSEAGKRARARVERECTWQHFVQKFWEELQKAED